MDLATFFPTLDAAHDFATCDGINSHKLALVHLIILKYINTRMRKIMKDAVKEKFLKGNSIHRARIFSNV